MTRPGKRGVPVRFIAAWVLVAGAGVASAQPFDLPEDRHAHPRSDRLLAGDPESFPPYDVDEHRVCAKECILRRYLLGGRDPAGNAPGGGGMGNRGPGGDPTDVLNNALDISVSPPGNSLNGSNTMTIRSNTDNLTTFTFVLRWNFTVTACTVTDAQGSYTVSPTVPVSGSVPASYGRTFTLLRPLNLGDTFTVRVDYSGSLQSGIGLGSVVYGGQNATATNPGVVCTLSEPYYAATWWPCKDGDVFQAGDNSDKATLTCSITAPSNFQSVSNGLLQGVDPLPGGLSRYRWTTNYPLSTYLVFFSTSEYNAFSTTYDYGTGTMPVQFYIYPLNDNANSRNVWLRTVDMLAAYRPVFGLYPFVNEKYGIYQFEFSGGMEHQTFTGQGRNGAFNENVTAHELAHQWWGDNITCKTWSDIWLNEGFATYAEAIWQERKPGSSGAAALRNAMNDRRPSSGAVDGTVYCYDYQNPSRVFDSNLTYRKGGWVLHQLRHIVGDQTFTEILQAYRAAFDGSAATTAEFIAVASGVADQDLNWFFQPWVYQGGAPTYEYGWTTALIGGQNYLRLSIAQTQSVATTFTMPIDVVITTGAGTINTSVRNDARTDNFLIPIDAPATGVALDPNNWILEYGKNEVAYTPGPPKIVSLQPTAGSTIAADSSPSAITIGFSDDVAAAAGDFSVTRNGDPVAFSFSYSQAAMSAMLTFAGPLSPGSYAVGVADTIRSAVGAIALDGELALGPEGAAVLPSGDGGAGGFAAYGFTVAAPACAADINHSGTVTVQDIFDFLAAYFAGDPIANFNGDAGITVQDLFDFLGAYFAGCP